MLGVLHLPLDRSVGGRLIQNVQKICGRHLFLVYRLVLDRLRPHKTRDMAQIKHDPIGSISDRRHPSLDQSLRIRKVEASALVSSIHIACTTGTTALRVPSRLALLGQSQDGETVCKTTRRWAGLGEEAGYTATLGFKRSDL